MSTKTLRKRIALVAVSALGAGLLSVSSANAAAPTAENAYIGSTASATGSAANALTVTTGVSDGTSVGYVTASAASVSSGSLATGTILTNAQIQFVFKSAAKLSAVVTGGNISSVTSTGSNAVISGDLSSAYDGTAEAVSVIAKPTGAVGSILSVSFYQGSSVSATSPTNGTLIGTYNLTVAAAGSSNAVSAAKSGLVVDTSSSFANTVDQAAGFSVVNGGTGYVTVSALDAYGVGLTGSHAVVVSATNGAKVGYSAYPTASSAVQTTIPSGVYVVQGTSNVAVTTDVTVTIDGVAIGTKTLAFSGDLAKIDVTVSGIAQKGSAATVNKVVSYKAYDAAGNRVALAAPSIKGTNAVVNTGSVQTAETTSVTGVVGYNCADYGTNSGLYLQATNTAGATISSPTFAVSCAGDLYTYTAALNKTSYKQGEIATLTITGLDSKGKPANDITAIGTSTYKPSISGSQLTAVNAPVYTDLTTNGKISYQFIVGNTAGSYSLAVDLPLITNPAANATDAAKTVGYTIEGDGSVSNAQILASIVKLIATINKQIAALQKSLKK